MKAAFEIGRSSDPSRSDAIEALDPETYTADAPDAHCALYNTREEIVGRCSLWWSEAPPWPGHRLGLIGHYAAQDAAAEPLLSMAIDKLAGQGCNFVIGPMDGNTSRRYRFVTDRGDAPAFFLEPDNPRTYPGHFRENGFEPLMKYCSSLSANLAHEDPRFGLFQRQVDDAGIRFRQIDDSRYEHELQAIHALSERSFQNNFLFSPTSIEEFTQRYLQAKSFVLPELVYLAEREGELLGYVFALPDWCQAERGEAIDTFIIKTLCVDPEFRGLGLGSVLAALCLSAGRDLIGYKRVIHALMMENNHAQKISDRYARIIRRYTLYGKAL